MIQIILTKCLDTLGQPEPDLSYVRGMIEVLLAMQEKPLAPSSTVEHGTVNATVIGSNPVVPALQTDEASILDSMAKAGLAKAKVGLITE